MTAHVQTRSKEDAADIRSQRIKAAAAIALLLAAGGFAWYWLGKKSGAEQNSETRVYQCASTGRTFRHDIVLHEPEPIKCDACGKQDAYIPEACWWTKDASGKWSIKAEPTYVILPYRLDPENGARRIKCPDCGRTVVGHNPKPTEADVERANAGGSVDRD